MSLETDRWGCPDWRNADAYPKAPEDLEFWQWRWEFLRRDPGYRELWQSKLMRHVLDKRNLFNGNRPPDPCLPTDYFHVSPFGHRPGGEEFYLPAIGELEKEMQERFGLANDDWKAKYLALVRYLENVNLIRTEDDFLSYEESFWIMQYRYFQVDIYQNLKPQFERIERWGQDVIKGIKERQPRVFGSDQANWPRHLRVIDAKDQGATHAEIAEQFVDEQLVDEQSVFARSGSRQTQKSRPKAIVSRWIKEAKGVMEKLRGI